MVSEATDEAVVNPQNQYALSKHAQESLALRLGHQYEIPTVALRYSIVQGPRQSFYNAYSGACRIFCLAVHHGRRPVVYEDGRQMRDFVNVRDAVRAGLVVQDVGGPAALAGVQPGDVLMAVNGTPVQSVEQVRDAVARSAKSVALLIQRDGDTIFVPVRIG